KMPLYVSGMAYLEKARALKALSPDADITVDPMFSKEISSYAWFPRKENLFEQTKKDERFLRDLFVYDYGEQDLHWIYVIPDEEEYINRLVERIYPQVGTKDLNLIRNFVLNENRLFRQIARRIDDELIIITDIENYFNIIKKDLECYLEDLEERLAFNSFINYYIDREP